MFLKIADERRSILANTVLFRQKQLVDDSNCHSACHNSYYTNLHGSANHGCNSESKRAQTKGWRKSYFLLRSIQN